MADEIQSSTNEITNQDRRKRFFCWLGVFVFPLFWSWFTLGKGFTRRERFIAFVWMAILVVYLVLQWDGLVATWPSVAGGIPVVLNWLTAALGVWLAFRIRFVPSFLEIIIWFSVLVEVCASTQFVVHAGQHFTFTWQGLLPPCLLALAHLAVEPYGRLKSKWKSRMISWWLSGHH